MKIFHCDHCGQLLFFENTACVGCGHRVAYLPDLQLVGSLDPEGDDLWRSPLPQAVRGYRLCQNDKIEGICNWAVPADPVSPQPAAFDRLIDSWFPLTYVLNNLNRGLGLATTRTRSSSIRPGGLQALVRRRCRGQGKSRQCGARGY